jgi:hypothetical protein
MEENASQTAFSEEPKQVTAVNRYFLLIRRILMARQLGFWFFGTSHTMLPKELRLFGEELILKYPNDPALISDVINILLDDEYGLGKLEATSRTGLIPRVGMTELMNGSASRSSSPCWLS